MKMLKKILGATAVCVALGAVSLKADFEQDLINICEWCKEDPYAKDMVEVRETYEKLYEEFQTEIRNECQVLRQKKGIIPDKAKDDIKGVFCPPTEGEAYLLIFGQKLWQLVRTYTYKTKDLKLKISKSGMKFCRFVFMRRMSGLVQHCIRCFSGRFGSKELFNEKDYDLNKETMAEILKPYSRESWYCEGSADGTVFKDFLGFKEGLKEDFMDMETGFGNLPFEDLKEVEARAKRVDKACSIALEACYVRMLNGFDFLWKGISKSFQEHYSACTKVQKEDFEVFLKRTEGNLESILKMRESIIKSDEEKDKNAEIILEELLSEKDAACDRLEKKSEELKALERKFEFVKCCSEPCELRKKLAKIGKRTTKDVQSVKDYEEIKEKLKEQDDYRSQVETLRKEVREAEEEVVRLIGEVKNGYKSALSLLSEDDNFEERKFVEYALHIAKCDAYLKSFFYLNTLFGNALRKHTSETMKRHAKESETLGSFGKPGLDKVVLTSDFDDE